MFGSLLLRRLYTRVEYLPMPFSNVMSSFTEMTQPASKTVGLLKDKVFLIAFALSFIQGFVSNYYFPWSAVFTGTPSGRLGDFYPAWDLTPQALLPWTGIFISLAPWEIGWALLLPVNVLGTALITWLGVHVIFPFVYMGQYWGPYNASTMGNSNSAIRLIGFDWRLGDLGFSLVAIMMGMLMAALIVPIIINWRQMAPIFKSLLGSEPSNDFDPDKPLSYRLTWWLTIGFFLLWYGVGVGLLQAKPDALLLFLVLISIQFFGIGRVLSETGGWYGAFNLAPYYTHSGYTGSLACVYGTTLGADIPSYVTTFMLSTRGSFYAWADKVPFFSLHSFKFADNTKTRLKGMVKILAIGMIIGVTVIAFVHFINRSYDTTLSWKLRGEYIKRAVTYAERGRPQRGFDLWSEHPNEAVIQIVFGFALVAVLSFLQPKIALLRSMSVGGVIWGFNGMYIMWVPT